MQNRACFGGCHGQGREKESARLFGCTRGLPWGRFEHEVAGLFFRSSLGGLFLRLET